MNILGIPVIYDEKFTGISDSRGLFFRKRVVVGPAFQSLTEREKGAVLLHEAGHVKLWHAEKRLLPTLWMLLSPLKTFAIVRAKDDAEARVIWAEVLEDSGVAALARSQEFEADRFAAGCGYGMDLARVFARVKEEPTPLHPRAPERIARLLATPSGGGI